MGRSGKSHPGRSATEKQDQFVRLIRQGVSNAEACRMVRINRRTGTRWRFGRTVLNTAGQSVHYPAVAIERSDRERHPRYLSMQERTVIADLSREGATIRAIATELGRSASTISRELRRNRDDSGRYRPLAADRASQDRMRRPRRQRRVVAVQELGQLVQVLLNQRWSPEQVAHELSERFADRPEMRLCCESIYQAIYDPAVPVNRPAKRRRRRRRVQGLERRGRLTAMAMIGDRPAEADDRTFPGHWKATASWAPGTVPQSALSSNGAAAT
jgi:IS30 family transposase